MKNYPLQLKRIVLNEVVCKAADAAAKEFAKTINLTTNPTFGRSEDNPLQWLVTLQVQFKAGEGEANPLQYTGLLNLTGIFMADPGIPEETLLRMIAVNGPSMLYGTARETVSNLTARGPHNIFLLPTLTFFDATLAPLESEKIKGEPNRDKAPTKARSR